MQCMQHYLVIHLSIPGNIVGCTICFTLTTPCRGYDNIDILYIARDNIDISYIAR